MFFFFFFSFSFFLSFFLVVRLLGAYSISIGLAQFFGLYACIFMFYSFLFVVKLGPVEDKRQIISGENLWGPQGQ